MPVVVRVLRNGREQDVLLGGQQAVCVDCGGPPVGLWSWDLLLLREDGFPASEPDFRQWRVALDHLRTVDPELLGPEVDRSAEQYERTLEQVTVPGRLTDRARLVAQRADERARESLRSAVRAWAWAHRLPPSGNEGICIRHARYVRVMEQECRVDSAGNLLVVERDQVIGGFPAGSWLHFASR